LPKAQRAGCKQLIVGGFAIIYSGYARTTTDVDLLMATNFENENKVFEISPETRLHEHGSGFQPSTCFLGRSARPGPLAQAGMDRAFGAEVRVSFVSSALGVAEHHSGDTPMRV
jgi:hypothetical protein